MRAGDCIWVSSVGGAGKRAAILRAGKRGTIGASCRSVHEGAPGSVPRINRTCKRERRTCMRPQNGRTFYLKVYGCSRMEPGQECRALQKVSLCDATICAVASDFFVDSSARKPTGGHQPFLSSGTNWMEFCRKVSSRGRHRNSLLFAGTVGLNHRSGTAQTAMLPWCEIGLASSLQCEFGSNVAHHSAWLLGV